VAAKMALRGMEGLKPEAAVTVLTSDRLSDNNSLDEPNRVIPKESRIQITGSEFTHEFPARSFTVLRLKTR